MAAGGIRGPSRLQPFAPYFGFKIGETGDVASRMGETFDKASPNRV
jgi:hypothetical protein